MLQKVHQSTEKWVKIKNPRMEEVVQKKQPWVIKPVKNS